MPTKKYGNNISTRKTKKANSLSKIPTRGNGLLDKIIKGKYINKGMMGTIYLAIDPATGSKYAYKIEKMLPRDVPHNLKSPYWREIDFAINLANKYPDQFMNLYDWKIDNNCEHKQDFSGFDFKLEDLPKSQQNYYNRVNASPYCSIKLWSLIDGILEDLIKHKLTISRQVFYDLFIQILYIVHLINSAGYFHNDFHMGNIGYVKTKQPSISILGHDIPTHGYIIKAIDFGLVLHDKYPMTAGYRHKYENDNDLLTVFNRFSLEWKTDKIKTKHGIKEWKWEHEWMKPIKISRAQQRNLEHYLPEDRKLNKDNYDFLSHKIYKLVEWRSWQQKVLNDTDCECIQPHYLIPLEHMLYLVKHLYRPADVLDYFIKHRPVSN